MHDLAAAARSLANVAEHVTDADLDRPTSCPDWAVRDLLLHVLGLSAHFVGVARHGAPAGEHLEVLPDDWHGVLVARLDDLAQAWRDPEAWTGEGEAGGVRMSNAEFGIVALDELVLHGWDLARAVGVPFEVADEDVAAIRPFVASFGGVGTPGLFGPAVATSGATGFDEVLALAGRDPAWSASARA